MLRGHPENHAYLLQSSIRAQRKSGPNDEFYLMGRVPRSPA
jgi:hypothetical protein